MSQEDYNKGRAIGKKMRALVFPIVLLMLTIVFVGEYFIDNEYNLNFVSTSDTHQVAKTLVAKGMGITIIDEITAKSTSADTVKVWELTPPLTFNVALMHLKSKPLTVIAKKFMNSLLKHN